MTSRPEWRPFAEPWRTTVLRTGSLALAVGLGVGLYQRRLAFVPLVTLMALWFTLGGHFLELLFRNRLHPRIGTQPLLLASARLFVWFLGGIALYAGALVTRAVLTGARVVPWPWWSVGVLFVGVELLIHLLLRARGQPSFYDGRG